MPLTQLSWSKFTGNSLVFSLTILFPYSWKGRRAWQPTPVFLPGESHGQRSLAGYSPRGHKESDTTEATEHTYTRGTWSFPEEQGKRVTLRAIPDLLPGMLHHRYTPRVWTQGVPIHNLPPPWAQDCMAPKQKPSTATLWHTDASVKVPPLWRLQYLLSQVTYLFHNPLL